MFHVKTHRKKSLTGWPHSVRSLTSLHSELHLTNDTQNSLSSEDRTLDLRATVEFLAHERFDIRTATAVHGGDVVLSPLHLKLSRVFELCRTIRTSTVSTAHTVESASEPYFASAL